MNEQKLLTKDDIDVRVAQTSVYDGKVKASLLLYKDARVDMRTLDALYGPFGWKRSHRILGDRLYCTVEVWDKDKKEWIAKEDVGTESNTEPEKGQASDSFKRACFNWGIGRELYTAPKITVALDEKEYGKDGNKIRVYATFSVSEIGYDDSAAINRLVIVDRFGHERFRMGEQSATAPAPKPATRKKTIGPQPEQAQSMAAPKPAPAPKAEPDPNDLLPGGKTYCLIVKKFAEGKKSKSGEDYRTVWGRMVNPSEDLLERFDYDVATYRMNAGIQPAF